MATAKKRSGHVEVTDDLCKGCELCLDVCKPRVLSMSTDLNAFSYHPVVYAGEGCTGSALCYYACPEPGALHVTKP